MRPERDGERVRLITRGGNDWARRCPSIVEAARKNAQGRLVIGGEVIIRGVDGISDFNALHSGKQNAEVQLFAFDVLAIDGDAGAKTRQFTSRALTDSGAVIASLAMAIPPTSSALAPTELPDVPIIRIPVQPLREKIFRLCRRANQWLLFAPPARTRGASRSSRNVGRDAMDVSARLTSAVDADGKTAWSWSPDAGIKFASDDLRATVATKPGTPGRARHKPKTIAQGVPVDPAEPVVTAACFFVCRRAMGEVITRHSLHPLFFRGWSLQNSGGLCRGKAPCCAFGCLTIRSV